MDISMILMAEWPVVRILFGKFKPVIDDKSGIDDDDDYRLIPGEAIATHTHGSEMRQLSE
jgi:hypothetical protein